MIYQEALIGYTKPGNMISILINENSAIEVIQLGDKNPNKPPNQKQKKKKKKKVAEELPVKKKRKKNRKLNAVLN